MRMRRATRRAVVKASGGLGAAALILGEGALGSRWLAAAQEATPMASPSVGGGLEGRYAAVRIRTLAEEPEAADVLATIEDGFLPLVADVPGFVAYPGVADPSSDQTAFVNVFADKAGADESTRVGGVWLQETGTRSSRASRPSSRGRSGSPRAASAATRWQTATS
jgi:hypothetical protein